MEQLRHIDKTWTLFLDRDGVINEEISDGYVLDIPQFKFLPGVKEALKLLSQKFGKIFLVTNQRGVGRGLMTEEKLQEIHQYMLNEIEAAGGRIDRIYYCTSVDDNDANRKPNTGMALQAAKEFEIDFSKSVMAGNSVSDMKFGKDMEMITVHLYTTLPRYPDSHPLIDYSFSSLIDFAESLFTANL